MIVSSSTLAALRALFFKNFFHLLLISSSIAMWAVPAWILYAVADVGVPALGHVAGATAMYWLNRSMVQGPRLATGAWLRRYSAMAFVLLLCSVFLLASSTVFALAGFLAGLAAPAAGELVADASRLWGLGGMAALTATLLFGYTSGQRQLGVSRVNIPMSHWTGEFRVLQLSDIHVGQNLSYRQLEGFVDRVNREEADLICLTGDIADGPKADLDRYFPVLGRLRARFGVIAILGNHDHYAGADRVEASLERNGITVLRDRAVTVDMGGERLHVIGLDDRGLDWARGMPSDPVLERLVAAAPPHVARMLLVHRPDVFRHAARLGIDLTLSGHTHGGQLAMPWFGGRRRNLAEFVTRFDRGLFEVGDSRLYVNCGLGVTGQRIRLLTPREISVFELGPSGLRDLAATDLTVEPLLQGSPEAV